MTTEATANTPLLEGKITKITGFGAFVELTDGRSGLIHISEIADRYIKHPSEVLAVGDVVQVMVKSVDTAKKRISLTMKIKK